MTYVVTLGCVDVKDKSCLLECPVDCIYEGERMLYIHPDECIDCGACEPACPNDAIAFHGELPQKMEPFADAARVFFGAMPEKPGSGRTAPVMTDAPFVRALPAGPRTGPAS